MQNDGFVSILVADDNDFVVAPLLFSLRHSIVVAG